MYLINKVEHIKEGLKDIVASALNFYNPKY